MTTRQDLRVRQGETWTYLFTYLGADREPVDLTGYSARMSVRSGFARSLEAFVSSGPDSSQGSITLTAQGLVTLSMSSEQTEGLLDNVYFMLMFDYNGPEFERRVSLIYDIELISPTGIVDRALQGNFIIERGVRYG